jgi:hypothetical protein
MPNLEASVRDQISLYVEGYISADDLNDALPDTWELDNAHETVASLVMLVIGLLAEQQNGDRLEDALRESLREHVSWTVERSNLSGVTTQPGLDVQVRAGAGTPLLVGRV